MHHMTCICGKIRINVESSFDVGTIISYELNINHAGIKNSFIFSRELKFQFYFSWDFMSIFEAEMNFLISPTNTEPKHLIFAKTLVKHCQFLTSCCYLFQTIQEFWLVKSSGWIRHICSVRHNNYTTLWRT